MKVYWFIMLKNVFLEFKTKITQEKNESVYVRFSGQQEIDEILGRCSMYRLQRSQSWEVT